jgi:omega-amidase
MNVACCQFDILWEDKPANYRRVDAMLDEARLPAGTLLLLPEMFATGFTMNSQAVAEPDNGPTSRFLSGLAKRHAIYVCAGLVLASQGSDRPQNGHCLDFRINENGTVPFDAAEAPPDTEVLSLPQNTALLFDPLGQRLAEYSKMHLFSYAGEDSHYHPGETTVSVPISDTIAALAICYDLRFPELFRAAVRQGAELLAVIACWPEIRESHWLALLKARAIENQCYMAAANRCGSDPSGQRYSGRSQIIDPQGQVLADADNHEAIIQAPIDPAQLRAYRKTFPVLRDIRLPV